MRATAFVMLMLAACAPPLGVRADAQPSPTDAWTTPLSPAAQQIRADLDRLDQELRADGVAAAGIGETADLGGGLTVRPIAVIEDSRCPGDVTCIWAGRLRIRANASGQEVEMTLGQPTQTAHGVVVFAVAKPSPWASWPVTEIGERPAYRFGFRRG
jgi:hypothetical protein